MMRLDNAMEPAPFVAGNPVKTTATNFPSERRPPRPVIMICLFADGRRELFLFVDH
jgi:hypothetical protein